MHIRLCPVVTVESLLFLLTIMLLYNQFDVPGTLLYIHADVPAMANRSTNTAARWSTASGGFFHSLV